MTIEEQIRDYIARNLLFSDNGFPYDNNSSFMEKGVIDSMGVLELLLFVEETFHINVPDQDLVPDNFDTVARLASYVRTKMALLTEKNS